MGSDDGGGDDDGGDEEDDDVRFSTKFCEKNLAKNPRRQFCLCY